MSKRGIGLIAAAVVAALIVVVAGWFVYRGARPVQMASIKLIGFGRNPTLVAAERKGFFQDEQLQVEYTQTPSSAVQMRGVLDGKWDIALTAPDNVMAYVEKENADLFVFMVADLGLNQKLFVRPEISSWADLRGKPIGVDALDTGFAFLVVRMLDRNGLKPGDYTFVSVGGNPERLDAMKSGKTVAGLLNGPPEAAALRDGYKVLATASELFPEYPGSNSAATTKRWASAHSGELVRFIRAFYKAEDWVSNPKNRDEAIGLIAQDQNIQRPNATAQYETAMKVTAVSHPNQQQVLSGLQTVLDLRWDVSPGSGPKPAPTKYYDASYAQKAEKR